jgi:predicted permease
MGNLGQDVRTALRQLSRRPAFTLTAVVTLAIGMGINTVAFAVFNAVLFKGPSTAAHAGVGRVEMLPPVDEGASASVDEFRRVADVAQPALDLAAEGRAAVAWQQGSGAETAWALFVSPNYFSMLNVVPIAGRLGVTRGQGGVPTAVIGERFWREELGEPSLANLTLRFNAVDVAVVGVVPESFVGPSGLYSPEVWLPLDDLPAFRMSPTLHARDSRWLFLLGKPYPGVSTAQVDSLVATAAETMQREWPDTHRSRSARFRIASERTGEMRGVALAGGLALAVIGLVLLLACFNVANLLLARAAERERDMGVRTALGASRGRLMRLVLTEGFVLATISATLALLVAGWARSLVGSFAIPIEVPQHLDLTPDWRVVAFTLGLLAIAGVLPGLWPAFAAANVNVSRALTSQSADTASGRPSRLGRWLVGAQIAGSTAFLAMSVLLMQSYRMMTSTELGFDSEHLLVAELEPVSHGHTAASAQQFTETVVRRLRVLPGVLGVTIADQAPFFVGFDRLVQVWPAGRSCDDGGCRRHPVYEVDDTYFRTLGFSLVAGREVKTGAVGEVIVNEAFAQQHWSDGRVLGQTLRLGPQGDTAIVVGVLGKAYTRVVGREAPSIYRPVNAETFARRLTIVMRTDGPPAALIPSFRAVAQSVDPNVPILSLKSMADRSALLLWPWRTLSYMFSICAVLALTLSVVGLAGVVLHAVSRRRREFGVRLSIGATPRDLARDVMMSAIVLLIPGLAVGLLLAAGAGQLARTLLFGVNVLSPATYLGVALAQCAIVAAACVVPAVRAARVDPLRSLRVE